VCNKLHHPEISPEQGASKIVKNISTDGEVMAKIKVACFFLGHGV